MIQRIVMHNDDQGVARSLGVLLECKVTISENHRADTITLYGFDDFLDYVLPLLRSEAPGWYVRTPTYG